MQKPGQRPRPRRRALTLKNPFVIKYLQVCLNCALRLRVINRTFKCMLCQIDAPRMAVVATRPGWRLPAGRTASQEVERLSNTLKLHKPSQILMSHAVRATRVEPMLGFSCRGASGNDKLCNKSFGTLKSLKTVRTPPLPPFCPPFPL